MGSRGAYQTGSASVQVLVPPINTLNTAFAAWPKSLTGPTSPGINSSSLPFSGGRIARNLRRRSERFDNRNSNDPMTLEIRGMSSAPPTNRPTDALETLWKRSAAATGSWPPSPSRFCCSSARFSSSGASSLAASSASCPNLISSRHGKIGAEGSEDGSEFNTQWWNLENSFRYTAWITGKAMVATIGPGGQLIIDGKGGVGGAPRRIRDHFLI